MLYRVTIFCLFILLMIACPIFAQNIIYVDIQNDEYEDGSMESPFNSIQEAVDNSVPDDSIFVASGVYHELVQIENDISSIGLFGGFNPSGWNRNIEANQTVIDGGESFGCIIAAIPGVRQL